MRVIVQGSAYDTETAELIEEIGFNDVVPDKGERLYRTQNGAFFLWGHFVTVDPGWRQECTDEEAQCFLETFGDDLVEDIRPLTDEEAQDWLERFGNDLVERHFGLMPEGGAAERRLTLRLPSNLAERLEAIAEERGMSLGRYLRQRLDRCAAEDGRPVHPV